MLIYGHGDVIRGLDEGWAEGMSPWRLVERGGRIYGRGVADNKGQHAINLAALQIVLAERGRLGFNVKTLIETSEEIGSPGLEEICQNHKAWARICSSPPTAPVSPPTGRPSSSAPAAP